MDGSRAAAGAAGRRVCRKDLDQLGTIVEADGSIKVKWDGGSTSYFRHPPANVRLKSRQSKAVLSVFDPSVLI